MALPLRLSELRCAPCVRGVRDWRTGARACLSLRDSVCAIEGY